MPKARVREWGWVLAVVAVVIATAVTMAIIAMRQNVPEGGERQSFRLSEDIYNGFEVVEIDAAEYERLVVEKQSFLVVVHMTICPAEFPLTDTAKKLAYAENLRIYFLTESEFKETSLAERIKYLPAMAVIRDGEVVDFLDAEADEDLAAYKSVEGLKEWIVKAGVEL